MNIQNTISKNFYQTTQNFANKELYFYKKDNQWIGLSGKAIESTVKDISFGLFSLGIGSGDQVAILSANSPRWCMTDYGIICSGSTSVTIYPTLIANQVEYILNDSGSKVLFVENLEQLDKIKSIWGNCSNLKNIVLMDDSSSDDENVFTFSDFLNKGSDHEQDSGKEFKELIEIASPDDLLTLIYTSGTTGNPKGVMLSHKNVCSNMEGVFNDVKVSNEDIWLSFLPLSHILERMAGHFSPFSVGAKVYFAESIETVPQNLGEAKPTIVVSVPRLYEKMYSKIIDGLKSAPSIRRKLFGWAVNVGKKVSIYSKSGNSISFGLKLQHSLANKLVYSKVKQRVGGNLRYFISGGAPLSQEIAEFFSAVNITILEGYGLTETSPVLTSNIPGNIKFGYVGRPIFNVEIKIAEDGEILARGPNIMKGYFNNEEATSKSIDSEGWFYTGDIGEIDEDGFLKITDRKKNIIVTSAGKNIAPAPMETAMICSSFIEQAVVLGDKRNFITALLVPAFDAVKAELNSSDKDLTSNEAIVEHPDVVTLIEKELEHSMKNFARFEKVKKFVLIPRLFTLEKGELTPSMKVIRKGVMKNFESEIEKMYSE